MAGDLPPTVEYFELFSHFAQFVITQHSPDPPNSISFTCNRWSNETWCILADRFPNPTSLFPLCGLRFFTSSCLSRNPVRGSCRYSPGWPPPICCTEWEGKWLKRTVAGKLFS